MAVFKGYQLVATNVDMGPERFSTSAVTSACVSAVNMETPNIINASLDANNATLTRSLGLTLTENNDVLVQQIADAVLTKIADAGIGRDPAEYNYPTFFDNYTSSMFAQRIDFEAISAIPSDLDIGSFDKISAVKDLDDKRMHWYSTPMYIDEEKHPDPQLVVMEIGPNSTTWLSAATNYGPIGIYMECQDGTGGITRIPIYQTHDAGSFRYNFIAYPGMKFGFYQSTAANVEKANTIFGIYAGGNTATNTALGSVTLVNNQGFLANDDYLKYSNVYLSSNVMHFDEAALISAVGFVKTTNSVPISVSLMLSNDHSGGWLPASTVAGNYYNSTKPTSFGNVFIPANTDVMFRSNSKLAESGTMKVGMISYAYGTMHALSANTQFAEPTGPYIRARYEFGSDEIMSPVRMFGMVLKSKNTPAYVATSFNDSGRRDCGEYLSVHAGGATVQHIVDVAGVRSAELSVLASDVTAFNLYDKAANTVRPNEYLVCADFSLAPLPTVINKNYALSGCTALRSVKLPSKVYIPAYAFDGCTSLSSIRIGDWPENFVRVQSSDVMYYSGCFRDTAVRSLSVAVDAAALSNTTRQAFQGCSQLSSVWISSDDTGFSSQTSASVQSFIISCDGIKNFTEIYGKSVNTITPTINNILVSPQVYNKSVTDLLISTMGTASYSWRDTYLQYATHLSSLRMGGMSAITNMTLPKLGSALTVDISATQVKNISWTNGYTTLKDIYLPSTLTAMPSFTYLSAMLSVFIPASATKYNSAAFQKTTGISVAFESDSVPTITSALTNIKYVEGTKSYKTSIHSGIGGNCVICKGATRSNLGTRIGLLSTNYFILD